MTLEQQVANLVTATTGLTNVVNGELESVRAENNTFKTSALTNIDDRFNTFISGFDQVKLRSSTFTIYVDPNSGIAAPENPVNNQSNPFNTIANALVFLGGYYWTNGQAVIKLSAGNHVVTNSLSIFHPCSIRIEGASLPDFSGVQAIVSQTTNANRSSDASTAGSNANLFNHLESIFQSRILFSGNSALFSLEDSSFSLWNCLVYKQTKDFTSTGISAARNSRVTVRNSAFMYFANGIQSYSMGLVFEEVVLLSANNNGLVNYGAVINQLVNSVLYSSGNSGIGVYNFIGLFNGYGTTLAYGNGSHGVYCVRGDISLVTANISASNGGCGFCAVYGNITSSTSTSKNNAQYGYRADAAIIKALGSDAATTGNTLGNKLENNAQQGYVIGVNA
jgi:hypothetical protein